MPRGERYPARRGMLMKFRKSSEGGHDPHESRWSGALSALLLVGSLAVLGCLNAAHAVRDGVRRFYYDHLYHRLARVRGLCDTVRRSRLQSMSIILTAVLFIPMLSFMRVGVAVTVDGRVLGYVEDETEVQNACRTLERSSSEVLGEPFSLDADISYSLAVTTQDSFLSADELPSVIADNVDSLATIAVVKVDGETVGACAEATQASQVLDAVKDEYTGGDSDAQAEFTNNVTVETIQAPTELLVDEETLQTKLTETSLQAQTYTVGEDDTMTSIAQEQGMMLDELLALNPDVIPERMAPGSTVTIKAATPLLSVKVTKTVDYTEEVPYDTVTRENVNLARGKTNVVQDGETGTASVRAEIVTLNGVEQDRTVLSRTVTKEPVDKIVQVGIKNTGVGTGSLIRPIAGGTVTSGYKYRWGRMHKGIDYGTPVGTKVRAADNGRVIVSEYSRSGYGYYVIIDHGNGMKTLYAHNSELLVNVGDTVEQGQTIARSGNTGNSTGPHCHFEVMIDGSNVNPANYV